MPFSVFRRLNPSQPLLDTSLVSSIVLISWSYSCSSANASRADRQDIIYGIVSSPETVFVSSGVNGRRQGIINEHT